MEQNTFLFRNRTISILSPGLYHNDERKSLNSLSINIDPIQISKGICRTSLSPTVNRDLFVIEYWLRG